MNKIFDYRFSYRLTLILLAIYAVFIVAIPVRQTPFRVFREGIEERGDASKFVTVKFDGVKFFTHKRLYYQVVRCGGSPDSSSDVILSGSLELGHGGNGEFHVKLPYAPGRSGTNAQPPLLDGGSRLAEVYMTLDMNGDYLSNRKPDANDRVIARRVISFAGDRVAVIDHSEMRDFSRPNVVKLKLSGVPEAVGRKVVFSLVRLHGDPTNVSQIIAGGSFRIKKNGAGSSLAYIVDSSGNRTGTPVRFRNPRVLDLYLFLDENGDYESDPRPNGHDKIIEGKGVVMNGYTVIDLEDSDLDTHRPGMTFDEYAKLTNIAREYGQGSGLRSEVALAQLMVSYDHSMIRDETNREAFCVQDATNTAAALCTTISRYLYLHAVGILYPGSLSNFPSQFWQYYVDMVNHGYVTIAGSRFCFVSDALPMIDNYLTHPPRADYAWEYNRNVDFTNDVQAIEMLKKQGSQVAIIREGENPYYSSHSYLVVLTVDGEYRMVDAGYNKWTGLPIEERYVPNQGRYIHVIQGYVPTEL